MPRKTGKSGSRAVRTLERTAQIVEGRKNHKTFEEIGAELGITRQSAYELWKKWFDATNAQMLENLDELRLQEMMHLEAVRKALLPDVLAGDEKSASVYIKASESIRKLFGLDAPTKSEIAGKDGAPLTMGVFAVPMQAPSVEQWQQQALSNQQSPALSAPVDSKPSQ